MIILYFYLQKDSQVYSCLQETNSYGQGQKYIKTGHTHFYLILQVKGLYLLGPLKSTLLITFVYCSEIGIVL